MENLGLLIYWITRLDKIDSLITVLSILSLVFSGLWIGLLALAFFANVMSKEEIKTLLRFKWIPTVSIVFLLISCFIPTTKEMALIYIAPKIFDSEIAKELPEELKTIKVLGMKKIKEILEK